MLIFLNKLFRTRKDFCKTKKWYTQRLFSRCLVVVAFVRGRLKNNGI